MEPQEPTLREIKCLGEYRINMSQAPLGIGSFGKVFKAHLSSDQFQFFAIKQIDLTVYNESDLEKVLPMLFREIDVMTSISHRNIVELHGGIHTPHNFYFVLEFCGDGNLRSRQKTISIDEILICVKSVAQAMAYFNSNDIIHRDIKPENILIHKGEIKIADMGFARKVDDANVKNKMTKSIGTPYYMAPEIFYGEKYDGRCDVWSLGIMFYELVYKKLPWEGSNCFTLFKNISKKDLGFPINKVDPLIKDLISRMLIKNQNLRPSFEEILKHPLFQRVIPNKLPGF